MIVCPRCTKENQDHYKFCLGCGAELPRDGAAAPKSFTEPTPPRGMPAPQAPAAPSAPARAEASAPMKSAPTPAPAAMPAPLGPSTVSCGKCGSDVPSDFKFCGTCGNALGAVSAHAHTAPAAAPARQPAPASAARGKLVLIRPDGSEGESVPLGEVTTLGREFGGLFANDAYLSPRHATFEFIGSELRVSDEASLNGVYLRIERDVPIELADGDIFRIGQELLRFGVMEPPVMGEGGVEPMGSPNPGYLGRLRLIIGRDATGNSFPIPPTGLHLGRERGDLIFPEDGYVSGLHARMHGQEGQVFLTDVGSSNGTFMRIRGQRPVKSGNLLLLGQQLFRAEF